MNDLPEVIIESLGGMCPVQGEGTVNGYPFYFRARGQMYGFCVSAELDGDPLAAIYDDDGYYTQEPWGDTEFAAGYMELDVAEKLIYECAKAYLEQILADTAGER